jgi:hypothetical protein
MFPPDQEVKTVMNHRQPTPSGLASPVAWQGITPASWLSFAVGAWLVLSPVTLSYADNDPWWNPMGMGTLIALSGLARAAGAVSPRVWRATIGLASAWLVGSAAWLAVGRGAAWNLALCGAALLLLLARSEYAMRRRSKRASVR